MFKDATMSERPIELAMIMLGVLFLAIAAVIIASTSTIILRYVLGPYVALLGLTAIFIGAGLIWEKHKDLG